MRSFTDIVMWYPLFGIPAGIGFAAVWVSAGVQRMDLQLGDRLLLVVPWLVLCASSVLFPLGKTLANLAEVVLVAASVPLAMMVRVALGRRDDQARVAMRIVFAVSGFSALVWLLLPDLGTPPVP